MVGWEWVWISGYREVTDNLAHYSEAAALRVAIIVLEEGECSLAERLPGLCCCLGTS